MTFTANKLFYISITGLRPELFPKIMANVSLILCNFFEAMKVSTYRQDNRNARILKMYWKLVYFWFTFLCIFYMNTERNYQLKQSIKRENLLWMIRTTKMNSDLGKFLMRLRFCTDSIQKKMIKDYDKLLSLKMVDQSFELRKK